MIRTATSSDLSAISELARYVQKIHCQNVPYLFKMSESHAPFLEWFGGVIHEEDSYVTVAEVEGKVSGYLYAVEKRIEESWVTHEHRSFYLHHISVDPRERKKGIGTQLLQEFREEATRRGIENVELDVWNFNDSAKKFFTKNGFQIASLRMNINGSNKAFHSNGAMRRR